MIDRDAYFDAVRETLFAGALTQEQVDGQLILLALWEQDQTGTPMTDLRWLAYCLATVHWETGTRMWSCEEVGKGQGRDYGEPDAETGEVYYGRGLVQLTWKDNYAKAGAALGLIDARDLVWYPHMALDSLIAARIMFRGMAEGWFTGARLNDYFNDEVDDPVNARRIVNGNDHDTDIAVLHEAFYEAVDMATYEGSSFVRPAAEVVLTVPQGIRVVVNGLVIEP